MVQMLILNAGVIWTVFLLCSPQPPDMWPPPGDTCLCLLSKPPWYKNSYYASTPNFNVLCSLCSFRLRHLSWRLLSWFFITCQLRADLSAVSAQTHVDAFDFGFYHLVWHTCVKSLWFVHSWLFVRVDIARFKTASIVLIILIKTIFFFFDFQLKEVLRLHWGRV